MDTCFFICCHSLLMIAKSILGSVRIRLPDNLETRYRLGDQAQLDTMDGAKGLNRKVKAVIERYAVTANGKAAGRWSWISCYGRWNMVKALNGSAT
jgi:hypothetical protein